MQISSISAFPDSSVVKEYTCNAGEPGSIPGSGRSAGEGIGCPLQNSWASLVAQTIKNLPVVQETWVPFLSWEGPQKNEMATCPSILAWRIPWTVYSPWGYKESSWLNDFHFSFLYIHRRCVLLITVLRYYVALLIFWPLKLSWAKRG